MAQPAHKPPIRVKNPPNEMFEGEIVNEPRMAELAKCTRPKLRKYRNLENGLPFIQVCPGDPIQYHVETALEWFKSHQTQNNPSKKKRG